MFPKYGRDIITVWQYNGMSESRWTANVNPGGLIKKRLGVLTQASERQCIMQGDITGAQLILLVVRRNKAALQNVCRSRPWLRLGNPDLECL